MSPSAAAIILGAFLLSFGLTGAVRRLALRHNLLDVPNWRSSHLSPTPRGGGLAIAVGTVVGLLALAAIGALPWSAVADLVAAGSLVAAVGFLDDTHHLPAAHRLIAHFAAAGIVVAGVAVGDVSSGFVAVVAAISATYVVWLINLTNFMDGIDGIAGVEAVTVSGGVAVLYALAGYDAGFGLSAAVLGSASLGFLLWNWPPAKIFMGDAGSGFLGLMFGALTFQSLHLEPSLFWACNILMGAFVVDATVTLLRRAWRREKVHEAHRTHAYQHLATRWGTHRSVTVAVAALNVCWLLPLAAAAAAGIISGPVGLFIAYAPLVAISLAARAGLPAAAVTPSSR